MFENFKKSIRQILSPEPPREFHGQTCPLFEIPDIIFNIIDFLPQDAPTLLNIAKVSVQFHVTVHAFAEYVQKKKFKYFRTSDWHHDDRSEHFWKNLVLNQWINFSMSRHL
jgi:hypothetical protein